MTLVLLDSSVLLAAAGSQTGAAYGVIELAHARQIRVVLSPYIADEVLRNLEKVGGEEIFADIESMLDSEMVEPSREEVLAAAECVNEKDAPIVAAAQLADSDYLISLDRKHLVQREVIECTGLDIVTPADFLHLYRADLAKAA